MAASFRARFVLIGEGVKALVRQEDLEFESFGLARPPELQFHSSAPLCVVRGVACISPE